MKNIFLPLFFSLFSITIHCQNSIGLRIGTSGHIVTNFDNQNRKLFYYPTLQLPVEFELKNRYSIIVEPGYFRIGNRFELTSDFTFGTKGKVFFDIVRVPVSLVYFNPELENDKLYMNASFGIGIGYVFNGHSDLTNVFVDARGNRVEEHFSQPINFKTENIQRWEIFGQMDYTIGINLSSKSRLLFTIRGIMGATDFKGVRDWVENGKTTLGWNTNLGYIYLINTNN